MRPPITSQKFRQPTVHSPSADFAGAGDGPELCEHKCQIEGGLLILRADSGRYSQEWQIALSGLRILWENDERVNTRIPNAEKS